MDKDIKLIKKIKNKSDKDAANKLISKYYKELYTYVFKQTTDKELSMDLTQEIWISILKSMPRYDEKKASFRTWLYRIATYNLVDYYRSKAYKYNSKLVDIDNINLYDDEDIVTALENKEDVKNIINIVNKLNLSSQQILRLKLFSDYTFLEISDALEIPESTAKTRYYAAIKKIKENFGEG